ncbi:hypothetical protein EMCG_09207 [[Emmonsia] crescens]|uniref:Uncharacterized protein n=1 Tax=[Emmonsia] crescens TaxID=73230 RepID=A0A0G2J3D4_9EURO|nr:hypothetical protein EMCG_09207 [Emmonsia crescens UAMH 3008]
MKLIFEMVHNVVEPCTHFHTTRGSDLGVKICYQAIGGYEPPLYRAPSQSEALKCFGLGRALFSSPGFWTSSSNSHPERRGSEAFKGLRFGDIDCSACSSMTVRYCSHLSGGIYPSADG